MITREQIAETIEFSDESSHGRESDFFDLGNGWGIKVYDEEIRREVSYVCQTEAAKHGLAPATGDKFDIEDRYCYVTEVVETIVPYDTPEGHDFLDDMFSEDEHWLDERNQCEVEIEERLGFVYTDPHVGNWGRDKHGTLIPIDWDKTGKFYEKLTGINPYPFPF